MATPPDSTFDLHLPAGTATVFEQRIAGIPESKRTAWRYHRVASDDSLAAVARTYHVTVADLADANQTEGRPERFRYGSAGGASRACGRSLGSHPALHHAPRRHAGFDRRSIRRIARSAAALEQDSYRHQGRAGQASSRCRARGARYVPAVAASAAAVRRISPLDRVAMRTLSARMLRARRPRAAGRTLRPIRSARRC